MAKYSHLAQAVYTGLQKTKVSKYRSTEMLQVNKMEMHTEEDILTLHQGQPFPNKFVVAKQEINVIPGRQGCVEDYTVGSLFPQY